MPVTTATVSLTLNLLIDNSFLLSLEMNKRKKISYSDLVTVSFL